MITVTVPQDKNEIKELYKKSNINYTENFSAVVAKFGEELLGYCLFELTEKGITVFCLEPQDDLSLADGVLRSALHVAAERSLMDARYNDTAPEEIFAKLGFIKNKDEKTLDIDKLFGGCKCCEKN